jgi:GntR family transcriptional regulator, transcriptional repressor for pyruvate dehydrogenase complex
MGIAAATAMTEVTGRRGAVMSEPPRRTRPVRVAEDIRAWVVERGFRAGDRVPDIGVFVQHLGMSWETVRSAFAVLEAQGFLETLPEDGEGWVIGSLTGERARALLADKLVVSSLSVAEIYQIRRLLEPDLVAELAGRLPDGLLDELEAAIAAESPSEEGAPGRQIAALGLHARLAREARNPLLGLILGSLADALSERAASGAGDAPAWASCLRKGQDYRLLLIAAIRDGNAREARKVMLDHLETALHLAEDDVPEELRLIAE